MGQYHFVCNLDKHQYLHPHHLGDGLKLMEFGNSAGGVMTGLALLLAVCNGRGGGDFRGDDPLGLVGSWSGDRISIIGDYFKPSDVPGFTDTVLGLTGGYNPETGESDAPLVGDTPWNDNVTRWKDISYPVAELIEKDGIYTFDHSSGFTRRKARA